MSRREKKSRAHEVVTAGLWILGLVLAIRLLPVLLTDLSTGIAMLTGFNGIAVSPNGTGNTTPTTSTATAQATGASSPATAANRGAASGTSSVGSTVTPGQLFSTWTPTGSDPFSLGPRLSRGISFFA